MESYGSKSWPIDLTCDEDVKIIDLLGEDKRCFGCPGAPKGKKIRGVMAEEEFEYLRSIGSEARRLIFEEYKK